MPRLPKAFRTLRWKLTLSAALTMILAVVVVTVVIVVQLSIADQRLIRDSELGVPLQIEASSLAAQLRPVLSGPEVIAKAESWLAARSRLCDLGITMEVVTPRDGLRHVLVPVAAIVVTDPSGAVLAGLPAATFEAGIPLSDRLPPKVSAVVRSALGGRGGESPTAEGAAGQLFAAAVVADGTGRPLGLVYLEASTGPLSPAVLGARVGQMLSAMLVRAAPVAVVVALLLGMLSTRGLLRRLERLSRASASWAGGDLTTRVDDESGDELGALARDLDEMAAELEALIDDRKKLAALEERNALARELHDTVKQNVFSVSMLLASAQTLIDSDRARALEALARARQAAHETGRELVGLIDQLRPGVHERGDLGAALETYAGSWSDTHGIPVDVVATRGERLSGPVEHQLLLIAREALSNVARHSRARCVEVKLEIERSDSVNGTSVRLVIRDDGIGFEQDQVAGPKGFGLESMSSRMATLGGQLEIRSEKGRGTTVVATCGDSGIGQLGGASDRDRAA